MVNERIVTAEDVNRWLMWSLTLKEDPDRNDDLVDTMWIQGHWRDSAPPEAHLFDIAIDFSFGKPGDSSDSFHMRCHELIVDEWVEFSCYSIRRGIRDNETAGQVMANMIKPLSRKISQRINELFAHKRADNVVRDMANKAFDDFVYEFSKGTDFSVDKVIHS